MSNNSDVIQLQQLIIQTCEQLGVELHPKISYFEVWLKVCKRSSTETLHELLGMTGEDHSPLFQVMRELILKELSERLKEE